MIRYRLLSTSMIHSPGFLRWAKNVYQSDPKQGLALMAKAYPELPTGLAQDFLDGRTDFETTEDGHAVFTTEQEHLS